MNSNPMVEEVSRLVGERLAAGGEVFLPGVGSLYTERRGARRISRRKIEPPCRLVAFSSAQRGESLVDEIAREAQSDASEAQGIYDRWLEQVRGEDVVTIAGVGELKFKNFTTDPAFDRVLNPQGHKIVRVKSTGRDWVLWIGVAAIVIAACIGGYQFLMLYPDRLPEAAESESAVAEATDKGLSPESGAGLGDDAAETFGETAAGGADAASHPESGSDRTQSGLGAASGSDHAHSGPAEGSGSERAYAGPEMPTAPTAPTAPTPQSDRSQPAQPAQSVRPAQSARSAGAASGVAMPVSGRRYVVIGVFSTEQNAARAVAEAVAKNPGFRYGVYRLGEKFMVSPFDAADAAACERFIAEQGEHFPGLWTYTAR